MSCCEPTGPEPVQPDFSGIDCSGTQPAWCVCLTNMLRVYVGDFEGQYDDCRLLSVIVVAAYQVCCELECCPSISVPSISCGSIDEDPTNYPEFCNLCVLKSACIIDTSSLRRQLNTRSIEASCGSARLKVLQANSLFNSLLTNGPCISYQNLIDELCFKCPLQTAACCAQIVGAFGTDLCCNNRKGRC